MTESKISWAQEVEVGPDSGEEAEAVPVVVAEEVQEEAQEEEEVQEAEVEEEEAEGSILLVWKKKSMFNLPEHFLKIYENLTLSGLRMMSPKKWETLR